VKPLQNGLQDYEFDPKSRKLLCLSSENMGNKKNQVELVRNGLLISRIEVTGRILKQSGIEVVYGISFGGQKKVLIGGNTLISILDLRSLLCHSRIKRPSPLNKTQTNLIMKNKLFSDRADRVRVGQSQQLLVYTTTSHFQVINCRTQKIIRAIPIHNLSYLTTQVFLERLHRQLIFAVNWPGTPKPHDQMKLLLFNVKTSRLITLLDERMTVISPNPEKMSRGFFLNALFHDRKIFLSVDFFEEPSFIRPTIIEINFHFEQGTDGHGAETAVIDSIVPRAIPQANTFLDIVDFIEEDNMLILKDIESKRIHYSLAENQFNKLPIQI
jgi:hypothetical protein